MNYSSEIQRLLNNSTTKEIEDELKIEEEIFSKPTISEQFRKELNKRYRKEKLKKIYESS